MTASAVLPQMAVSAIATLFEQTINDTRLFWSQREDGSLRCSDWEWCCGEIPTVLSGLGAVVFITEEPSGVCLAPGRLLVVSLDARRVWGKWRVLRRPPRDVRTFTWDDRLDVRI